MRRAVSLVGAVVLVGLSAAPAAAWRGRWRGVMGARDAQEGAAVVPGRVPCRFQEQAVVWLGQVEGDQCRYADAEGKPQVRRIAKGGGGFSVIEPTPGYQGFQTSGMYLREGGGFWASRGVVSVRSHGLTRALCVAEGLAGGAAARDTLGWVDFPVAADPVCRTAKGASAEFRLVETTPADAHVDLSRAWKVASQLDATGKERFAVPAAGGEVGFCRARTAAESRYLLPGVIRGEGADRVCVHVAGAPAKGAPGEGAVTLAVARDLDAWQALVPSIDARMGYGFGDARGAEGARPGTGLTNGRLKAGVVGTKPAYLCRDASGPSAQAAVGVVVEERCLLIEGEALRPAADFDVLGVYQRMR